MYPSLALTSWLPFFLSPLSTGIVGLGPCGSLPRVCRTHKAQDRRPKVYSHHHQPSGAAFQKETPGTDLIDLYHKASHKSPHQQLAALWPHLGFLVVKDGSCWLPSFPPPPVLVKFARVPQLCHRNLHSDTRGKAEMHVWVLTSPYSFLMCACLNMLQSLLGAQFTQLWNGQNSAVLLLSC